MVERCLTDMRERGELGSLAITFATLANNQAAWVHGLRGWNMETSPYLDKFRAEGRLEGAREIVLRLGKQKFGKAPARKQQKLLEAIDDIAEVEALAERLLNVDSWPELLGEV